MKKSAALFDLVAKLWNYNDTGGKDKPHVHTRPSVHSLFFFTFFSTFLHLFHLGMVTVEMVSLFF